MGEGCAARQCITPLTLHTKLCSGVWPFFPRRMSKDISGSQRSQWPQKFKMHFEVRRLCLKKEGTYYSEQWDYQRDDASEMAGAWALLPQTCAPQHPGTASPHFQNLAQIRDPNTLLESFLERSGSPRPTDPHSLGMSRRILP